MVFFSQIKRFFVTIRSNSSGSLINLVVKPPLKADTREFIDSEQEIKEKLNKIQKLLKLSKFPLILTGAGVSTDSGIPDYRSGKETIVKTGPGKWERDQGYKEKSILVSNEKNHKHSINAWPNKVHMLISSLINQGIFKGLITQNVDNLHHKSGIPREKMIELHGNISMEQCSKCEQEYYRDFYCRDPNKGHTRDHLTGRQCIWKACSGDLKDSLVFFGENLKEKISFKSGQWTSQCDFLLIMGTSLTVASASRIPKKILEKGNPVALINLQNTFLSQNKSVITVNSFLENVANQISLQWKIPIPEPEDKRFIVVRFQRNDLEDLTIEIISQDWEMNEKTFIKNAQISYFGTELNQNDQTIQINNLLFQKSIQTRITNFVSINKITFNFYSNLNEKSYTLEMKNQQPLFSNNESASYLFYVCQITLQQDFSWKEEISTSQFK